MLKASLFKSLIVIVLSPIIVAFSVDGFGKPPEPRHPPGNPPTLWRPPARVIIRYPKLPPSMPIHKIPPGYLKVVVGGVPFFYYNGFFYRKYDNRYVVVQPPVGAIVSAIPAGFVTFVNGGITYYFYGGIYYRRVLSGYEVVDCPSDAVVVSETTDQVDEPSDKAQTTADIGERVSVTAHLLNVRFGPGKEHPVIQRVARGSILIIKGAAPGWYYVQLPNGKYGWVMVKFTAQTSPPTSG